LSAKSGFRVPKFAYLSLLLALSFFAYSVHAQDLTLPGGLADNLAAPGNFTVPAQQEPPVTATLAFDVSAIVPGESFTAILTLVHADGWHTYGPDQLSAGLPTTIEWKLSTGLSADEIIWPAPDSFTDRGLTSSGYSGTLNLPVKIHADKNLRADTTLQIGATVNWLACKTSCIPGQAGFDYQLPVIKASPGARTIELLLALLGALLGGLILNLMPCVLPVLSLKLHSLIAQSGASRRDSIRNGLAYTLGVLVSFWILAGMILAFKAGGSAAGWGFQFQDPRFVVLMAIFFMAFALNMLGVFEIGSGAAALSSKPVPKEGFPRAFVSGLLATAAATPCTAPFMGTAVGFALSSSPTAAFLVFGALALGMASPILFLSAFPSLSSRLPKPGRWMETLRQILGFFLLATVLWLLSVLSSLTGAFSVIPALMALLGTGAAAWIWGRWSSFEFSARIRIIARIVSAAIFASSLVFALLSMPASDSHETAAASKRTENPKGESSLPWQAYHPDLLAELRAKNVPVFVDFTADWCLSCKANEFAVLDRAAVVDEFAKLGVTALKADWTRSDPEITEALASYGRSSVPLYLLFIPHREKPIVLPEILTIPIILKALEEIP